ncbi:hypothetical protein GCM10011399_15240 [Subtercola lobariae]|uniref:Uncharacterized protein n=2 Tax=Subtercola lobariae TaxID=1588641 RepID=A0A917EXW6_9MICO|nr:hypothetical protein GCM10011399_15240 [Subtercola lobariae]
MVADMVRLGRTAPEIYQIDGPYVRTVLLGGEVDVPWLKFLNSIKPSDVGGDLDSILALRCSVERGWITSVELAPVLQKTVGEADFVLRRLTHSETADGAVLRFVSGYPLEDPPVFTPGPGIRAALGERLASVFNVRGRERIALEWARSRGRVSSPELADVAQVAGNNASSILKGLVTDGALKPSRASGMGRGLYYLLAGKDDDAEPDDVARKPSERAF